MSYQVTLTRAHKVVERIRVMMASLESEILGILPVVHCEGYAGNVQLEETHKSVAAALELIPRHAELSATLRDLRTQIGAANVNSSVNALLAEQEHLIRRIGLLKKLAAPTPGAVPLDGLPEYRPLVESRYSEASVAIRMLPDHSAGDLATALAKLQREAFHVSDRLSEANATKTSITMPDEVATNVGLL